MCTSLHSSFAVVSEVLAICVTEMVCSAPLISAFSLSGGSASVADGGRGRSLVLSNAVKHSKNTLLFIPHEQK